jgi:hypothetical protein
MPPEPPSNSRTPLTSSACRTSGAETELRAAIALAAAGERGLAIEHLISAYRAARRLGASAGANASDSDAGVWVLKLSCTSTIWVASG